MKSFPPGPGSPSSVTKQALQLEWGPSQLANTTSPCCPSELYVLCHAAGPSVNTTKHCTLGGLGGQGPAGGSTARCARGCWVGTKCDLSHCSASM